MSPDTHLQNPMSIVPLLLFKGTLLSENIEKDNFSPKLILISNIGLLQSKLKHLLFMMIRLLKTGL